MKMTDLEIINELRNLVKSVDVIEKMEYDKITDGLTDLDDETKTNLEFLHREHDNKSSSLEIYIDELERRIFSDD